MHAGIDSYSYHRLFGELRPGERPVAQRWPLDPDPVLAHADALGVRHCFLETCYLPEPDLLPIKALGRRRDLSVSFSWGHGWPPGTPHGLEGGRSAVAAASLDRWIDAAAACGHAIMRITAGSPATRGDEPAADLLERLIPVVTRAADRAAASQIELAIENHGDLQASDLVDQLTAVDRGNVGVCLDTVNLLRVGDDLLEGSRLLAPWTLVVHMKDTAGGDLLAQGGPVCTALGEGTADLHGVLAALAAGGFNGPVCVELASLGPGEVDELDLVARSVAWLQRELG